MNELKKQQSFQATFEKKDGRSSLLSGEALLRMTDMKKQSITVDMDLLHEESDPSERLKHAAKAAKEGKAKRKAGGQISASDIIKETDETRHENVSNFSKVHDVSETKELDAIDNNHESGSDSQKSSKEPRSSKRSF